MNEEFVHHLRQAEADLGLARTSVGLALTRSPASMGVNLRLMVACLELAEAQLRGFRQLSETPVGGPDS